MQGGAKDDESTMRSVASLLARPFDPIGLLSPFILQARLIMKECHLLGMKWSDTLPHELQPRWKRWVGQLSHSWMDPLLWSLATPASADTARSHIVTPLIKRRGSWCQIFCVREVELHRQGKCSLSQRRSLQGV